MLRRNITRLQAEAAIVVIGIARWRRRKLIQGGPFYIKSKSLYRFSLRYAVTDCKPFQSAFGV